MSMRKSTTKELRMLRIVARHYLAQHSCMFCNTTLVPETHTDRAGRRGHPIDVKVTEHHIDLNSHNNKFSNRAIVHQVCHKKFHMMIRTMSTEVAMQKLAGKGVPNVSSNGRSQKS